MSGRMAQIAAEPSPYWATTPGRKLSMNTSALPTSARTASAPSQVRMSTARERLPALSAAKPTGVSPASPSAGPALLVRFTSPPVGVSTWMISALPLRQIDRRERAGDYLRPGAVAQFGAQCLGGAAQRACGHHLLHGGVERGQNLRRRSGRCPQAEP